MEHNRIMYIRASRNAFFLGNSKCTNPFSIYDTHADYHKKFRSLALERGLEKDLEGYVDDTEIFCTSDAYF